MLVTWVQDENWMHFMVKKRHLWMWMRGFLCSLVNWSICRVYILALFMWCKERYLLAIEYPQWEYKQVRRERHMYWPEPSRIAFYSPLYSSLLRVQWSIGEFGWGLRDNTYMSSEMGWSGVLFLLHPLAKNKLFHKLWLADWWKTPHVLRLFLEIVYFCMTSNC